MNICRLLLGSIGFLSLGLGAGAIPAIAQLEGGEPFVTAKTYTIHSRILDGERKITVRLARGICS